MTVDIVATPVIVEAFIAVERKAMPRQWRQHRTAEHEARERAVWK